MARSVPFSRRWIQLRLTALIFLILAIATFSHLVSVLKGTKGYDPIANWLRAGTLVCVILVTQLFVAISKRTARSSARHLSDP
jgi:hypothetical protein